MVYNITSIITNSTSLPGFTQILNEKMGGWILGIGILTMVWGVVFFSQMSRNGWVNSLESAMVSSFVCIFLELFILYPLALVGSYTIWATIVITALLVVVSYLRGE